MRIIIGGKTWLRPNLIFEFATITKKKNAKRKMGDQKKRKNIEEKITKFEIESDKKDSNKKKMKLNTDKSWIRERLGCNNYSGIEGMETGEEEQSGCDDVHQLHGHLSQKWGRLGKKSG